MSTSVQSTNSGGAGSTFSFDGLASGLNTTQVIAELMTIEARPQTLAKLRMKSFQNEDSALTSIKGKLTTLKVSAGSVSSALDWQTLKATSSNTDVASVTASSGSSGGTITFSVDSLAQADSYTSGWTTSATTNVVVPPPAGGGPNTITVGVGSDARTVDVGDGTLDSVVSAINSQSNFKLSASAIQVGTNSYRLQLTASEPGAANAVTFTAAQFSGGGTWLHPTTGADAQITVGTGADSFQIKGSSNVLANVLPGVTISLNKLTTTGQSVTVSSQRDPDAMATKIQTMVTDLNAVILEIAKQTKYDPTTKTAAPLLQNSAVRQIRQQLAEAVSGDASNNAGLAGISFDKDGTILFDKSKFVDQMAKNPVGTQALFNDGTNPGLGKRLVDAVSNALDTDTGYLVGSQKSVQDTVSAMQTTIDGMQLRLDRRQIELKNQFTAMETALNTLKSQGSWLSSQLGSSTGG